MFSKIFKQLIKHKFISGAIAILIIGGGYFGYTKIFSNNGAVRYATAQVKKGSIVVSISGSGQVSVFNQVDIKSKASGEAVYVGVKNGEEIGAGALIAEFDARDARKNVRDAEANLSSAKISLEKLKKPADSLSILQAENSYAASKDNLTKLKLSQELSYQKALESKQKGEDDLKKAYEDGFNAVSGAFLDLPTVITGLQDTLFSGSAALGGTSQFNIDYYTDAVKNYDSKVFDYKNNFQTTNLAARKSYDENFAYYKASSRFSGTETIDTLINQTYDDAKNISEAIKNASNLIQFYQDKLTERSIKPNSLSDSHLSVLNGYTAKINSRLSDLLSIKSTIKANKEAIINFERDIREMNQNQPFELSAAEQSVKEKEYSLAKLKAGADSLDIESSELAVKQRENALSDAKEKLDDYFLRAPFDGVVAKLNIKKGDSVSSASVITAFITKQKIAEISLNEVDVAKIKVGQKATLTFDAIPNLSISGQAAEVDTVGTVSQGVVTYAVKIAFDTQDDRVKPGMSVSAAIITEVKSDTLFISNSAVKSQGGISYAEIVEGDDRNSALAANLNGVIFKNIPRRRQIETGTISDEFTEIVSGLKEGDVIVIRTIQPTAVSAQQNSSVRIPGITGGGGGRWRRK